jgi:hypothetical protein
MSKMYLLSKRSNFYREYLPKPNRYEFGICLGKGLRWFMQL